MRKLNINLISGVALFLVVLLAATVAMWSLEPTKNIITVKDNKISIIPNVAHGGDTLLISYYYCKNKEVQSGVVTRYLKDSIVIFLPTVISNVKKGCAQYNIPLELPKNLSPDTYTYNVQIRYKINPIKSATYYFTSEPFTIIK